MSYIGFSGVRSHSHPRHRQTSPLPSRSITSMQSPGGMVVGGAPNQVYYDDLSHGPGSPSYHPGGLRSPFRRQLRPPSSIPRTPGVRHDDMSSYYAGEDYALSHEGSHASSSTRGNMITDESDPYFYLQHNEGGRTCIKMHANRSEDLSALILALARFGNKKEGRKFWNDMESLRRGCDFTLDTGKSLLAEAEELIALANQKKRVANALTEMADYLGNFSDFAYELDSPHFPHKHLEIEKLVEIWLTDLSGVDLSQVTPGELSSTFGLSSEAIDSFSEKQVQSFLSVMDRKEVARAPSFQQVLDEEKAKGNLWHGHNTGKVSSNERHGSQLKKNVMKLITGNLAFKDGHVFKLGAQKGYDGFVLVGDRMDPVVQKLLCEVWDQAVEDEKDNGPYNLQELEFGWDNQICPYFFKEGFGKLKWQDANIEAQQRALATCALDEMKATKLPGLAKLPEQGGSR